MKIVLLIVAALAGLAALTIVVRRSRARSDRSPPSKPTLTPVYASRLADIPLAPQMRMSALAIPPSPPRPTASLGKLLKEDINLRVTLGYEDREGVVTTRDITIQEIYGKQGDRSAWTWVNWIVGYCHLRNENRQFAVKRIRAIRLAKANASMDTDAVEPWLATLFRVRRTRDLVEPVERDSPEMSFRWMPITGEPETYCGYFSEITADGGHVFGARFAGTRDATPSRKARSGEKVFDMTKGRITDMRLLHHDIAVEDPMQFLHIVRNRGETFAMNFLQQHSNSPTGDI
jgi:hypothetical protein